MTRLFHSILLVVALASCSFAPIRIGIQDITLPGNSSQGQICYVKVTEGSRVGFSNATYNASATYTSNAPLGGGDVEIRVYGRSSEPADTCVATSDVDIALSEPLTLSPSETKPKPIEIGGGMYGGDLADLIRRDAYWLGAALTGGATLSLEERIKLTDGVVSVYF